MAKLPLPSIQGKLTTLKNIDCNYKLFIALLVCNFIVIYLYATSGNKAPFASLWRNPDFEKVTSNLRGEHGQLSPKEIIILHWTKFYDTTFPDTVWDSDSCSILKTGTIQQPPISRIFDIPCRMTPDRRYLSGSHAVVFHSPNLNYGKYLDRYLSDTRHRAPNQIWVWYQGESPLFKNLPKDLKAYRNVFNWTMSYRRDSDVYYPYGYVISRNISKPTASDNPSKLRRSLKKKTGLAAWIVSHCSTGSKRESFVKQLQKHIPVDIFGKCGKHKCPPIRYPFAPCYNHIQAKYKFYFSFENSLCLDYFTEKFFLALQTNMVPVVFGGGVDGRIDYLAVAPQNSFIDARKFKSLEDLANYLIYLDGNDEEYLKYFEWKVKYQVIYKDYDQQGIGWCNLCQRVYEQISTREQHSWNKWYTDLYTWWNYASVRNASAEFPPTTSLDSQSKSSVSLVGQSFQYSSEKLKPICVRPKANFPSYE